MIGTLAATVEAAPPPASATVRAAAVWWQGALVVLALVVPTAGALLLDDRQLNGIAVWVKPLKFQLAAALHLATLALLVRLAVEPGRGGAGLVGVALASSAAALGEVLYITWQAARGRASHYNEATPLEQALYGLMGLGALVLIVAAAVVGGLALLRPRAGIGPGLRWGTGLGLGLGCAATFVTAGYLAGQPGHWVGGEPSDASGLPLTGWSTTGGDLRVPHFFALHLMQVVPLTGWLADRTIGHGRAIAFAVALAGLAVVALTFAQALAGRPWLAL